MAHYVSRDFAGYLRTHRDAVQKPFLLEALSDCVERWSIPGALVIGDAAPTMSPVGGQGLNIALRDAIVAANHLIPVLAPSTPDRQAVATALAAIEAARLPEIRRIQTLQAQPPKLMLSRAWWGEPVRRLVGALLGSTAVRRRAAGRVSVFFHGVTQVSLENP
jgi:2-polyprenyl-6-methoxyphenol hydroxylase-like FAD-dependent oxidoreductase